MELKYKPTKRKKEKAAKTPKEPKVPKAEKPIKIGTVQKVKTGKPAKTPKSEKAIKEDKGTLLEIKSKKEKTTKAPKEDKIEKIGEFEIGDKSKKKLHFSLKDKKTRIIFISVVASVLVLAAILAVVIINNKKGNEPVKITISEFPKLSYYVGEEPDYSGLTIAIVKQNKKSDYVKYTKENASDFIITGFNSSRPYEEQVITVMYNGLSCVYRIAVKELPETVRELVGISIKTYPKTEYKVGEWLDTDGGMLLLEYSDGTTERTIMVNNYISDGWDEAWEGGAGESGTATYTLTVKYKDKDTGIVKRTTYDITVTAE